MRRIALLGALLFASACSDGSGRIENGRFYAPKNAFDVEVPYPSSKTSSANPPETESEFSKFEQSVNFQIPFGNLHRIERFKIGAPHFNVDRTRSTKDQLMQAEAEFTEFLKSNGFNETHIVSREFKKLGDYDALVDVYAIPNVIPTNYRAVAFVITPNYVMLLQHSHPEYTAKDRAAIVAELERFYATLHQRDV